MGDGSEVLEHTAEQVNEALRVRAESAEAENAHLREVLAKILGLAQDTMHALPPQRLVARNLAAGPLLTLSGLAESALEADHA